MADTFYPFYLDCWGGQTELKTPNPKKVAEEVKKILEDAPEEYDTFKEVADELDSTSDKLTSVEEHVTANENAISILNGDAATEGSVANTVATEIAKVIDSAPETLDTLKEVADYIEQHEAETAEIKDSVTKEATAREEADTALQEAVGTKADADSVYVKSEVDTKISQSYNEMTETVVALANSLTGDINKAKVELQASIDDEATAREGADTTLQGNIDALNNSNTSSIAQIQAMITALQSKVASLTTSSTTTITQEINTATSYNDSSGDYVISAYISANLTITNANSVTLTSDVIISNNARLNVTAEDVTLDGVTVSGDFEKDTSNATISLNGCKYVTIKDMVFDGTYTAYNGYEIGLGSSDGDLPVSVIIDNCQFLGENSNNAINIFGTESNAIVTISNCYFKKTSNVLRWSNKTNAKNVTVNIVNCTVDEWETTSPYQGFLLCQDYVNTTSVDDAKAKNIFGPEKLSVNFTNLVHAEEKVLPTDISEVCGTKDENQVVYVYRDVEKEVLGYDEDFYPSVTFA